ncbi:MAG TPA: DUF1778 domain-containing protein [Burkholderiales bacterium]
MTAQRTPRSRQDQADRRPAGKVAGTGRGRRLPRKQRPKTVATERIDVRVSPEAKKLLIRATELLGSNLTAFVLESAQERAAAVVERYERLHLSDRDRDRLLDALDNPPPPSERLLKALRAAATPSPE